jgi:hypothetical protein
VKTEQEWRERWTQIVDSSPRILDDDAIQLGREMADERAEEIARLCEARQTDTGSAWDLCQGIAAALARSTITKPKTREQVLEDAAREALVRVERFSGKMEAERGAELTTIRDLLSAALEVRS